MKRIDQDIAEGKLNNIYLLYGEENYLRNQYRDKLMKALNPNEDTINVSSYLGKDISAGEIIDLAETMPFLSDRRVILIEDSGLFASGGVNEKLADYMKTVPETTFFVFSEENVDKRLKMYKAVNANGHCAEFGRQSSETLKVWVIKMLRNNGLQITGPAYAEFINRTGNDMLVIKSEIDKLISYAYGKDSVSISDVCAICTPKIEDKIFDMLDNIMVGRADLAMKQYGDLLELQEEPEHILYMIIRELRLMLHVKVMNKENVSVKETASNLKVEDFVVKKLLSQTAKVPKKNIERAIEAAVQTEENSRRGIMDVQIGTEILIVTLSSGI